MASDRTIAKRAELTRTWTVTRLAPDGRWYQAPYNLLATAAEAERKQKLQRVRLPGKKERAVMRAQKEIDCGKEESNQAESAPPEDR